jgi:hypothetical protein
MAIILVYVNRDGLKGWEGKVFKGKAAPPGGLSEDKKFYSAMEMVLMEGTKRRSLAGINPFIPPV